MPSTIQAYPSSRPDNLWMASKLNSNYVLSYINIWVKVFKNGPSKIRGRQPNFVKAVFHKFYLVHSWILCLICFYCPQTSSSSKLTVTVQKTLRVIFFFFCCWRFFCCYFKFKEKSNKVRFFYPNTFFISKCHVL